MKNPFNLIGQKRPVGPAEIERRLRAAEAAIPDLEARHRAHLLDVEQDPEGAAADLTNVAGELEQTRQRVRNLSDALAEATARQEAHERAQRAAVADTQLASVRAHLGHRDRATEALAGLLAPIAEQWRQVIKHSDAAAAACPPDFQWPQMGGLLGADEIARAVANELYRLSGKPPLTEGPPSFPGAQPISFETAGNPGAMTPLVDRIREASAHISRRLGEWVAVRHAR